MVFTPLPLRFQGVLSLHLIIPLTLAYTLYVILRWYRLRKIMPPGPRGLPWVGNMFDMPESKPWLQFDEWNREYGPVASLMLGSKPVVILGKAQAAWDLLEKRSDIYSSRPRFIMAGEILSGGRRGLFMQYNDRFRRWRKVLHTGLHSRQVESYKYHQSLEASLLMKDLLDTPKNYVTHLQRFAASIAISVSYGRRVEDANDWVLRENLAALEYMFRVSAPGKFIVESWPALLRLPKSWQWFRRGPEERQQKDIQFLKHLWDDVKNKVHNGTARDCLASQSITNIEKIGMHELDLAYAVSAPFAAGVETAVGSIMTLMVALLHYPEAKRKIAEELYTVVGPDRMPDFNDKNNLPYLNAAIKESMRWRPAAVMGGTPHAVITDDVYEGYFIPKGTTVIANMYGMMKDEELFPEPELFKPERFLNTDNPRFKDFDLPFGFGRRQCPGLHLARNTIFIAVARMLWAFDVLPALDSRGKPILPDPDARVPFSAACPVTFDCCLVPRGDRAIECVMQDWDSAKSQLENW